MSSTSLQGSRKYDLDCQVLHCYLSGNVPSNTQRLALREILVSRDFKDHKLIRQTYAALYNQDLHHLLSQSQRNNPYFRAVYLCMSERQERDADIIRASIYGGNVNLNTLLEVACTRPSLELQSIKQAYTSKYKSNVEHDVALKVTGGFKEILVAILRSCRNYGGKVDMSMAMCDAKTLYEAMESGKAVDQRAIVSVVSQRNSGQIRAILGSYKQLYGHELAKSLKRSKCGQFGKELRIVIRCIQHPHKFFAKQLRLKNGDAREIITRIVITRSNQDIKEINKSYATKTGSSLETLVRKEFNNGRDMTNGIVAEFLVGLIKG